jgi:hypothetical protein
MRIRGWRTPEVHAGSPRATIAHAFVGSVREPPGLQFRTIPRGRFAMRPSPVRCAGLTTPRPLPEPGGECAGARSASVPLASRQDAGATFASPQGRCRTIRLFPERFCPLVGSRILIVFTTRRCVAIVYKSEHGGRTGLGPDGQFGRNALSGHGLRRVLVIGYPRIAPS